MPGVDAWPDTMQIALSRTDPFRHLQSRIGSATYRLNTILVGLEHVAAGGDKIGSLPVTWTKPKDAETARQVADQARIFACTAAIVLAVDVIDNFIRDVPREEWLSFSEGTIKIATKAETRPKEQGGDHSMAERAGALCAELGLDEPNLLAALDLFAKWRNSVVHQHGRDRRLQPECRQTLMAAKDYFHEKYSHLDIELAIRNFESGKSPVPKEVTSLIAAAQNLCRSIDAAAIKRVASSSETIEALVISRLKSYFRSSEGRHLPPWQEISEIWQGSPERRKAGLCKVLTRLGITQTTKAVSAPLSDGFLDALAALDRQQIADRLEISSR